MIVKPIELANICAIFPSIKTKKLPQDDFKKLVQDSMLIDSDNAADNIIVESLNSGLITVKSGNYYLTKKGQQISRYHKEPSCQITDKAQDSFIKNVFLNTDSNNWCCSEFIAQFQVDTVLETFVYDRNTLMLEDDTKWLILLSSVGLIEVDEKKAVIHHDYLEIINDFLLSIRNPIHVDIVDTENEKNRIGDLAENLAMQHEQERLSLAGYPSLALLVQQISKVDKSAGYDILSFEGTKIEPNSNIFIEVKGTRKSSFRFIWSSNEMNVANKEKDCYWIYGYTNVDIENERADGPIKIKNPVSNLAKLGYITLPLDCYVFKL